MHNTDTQMLTRGHTFLHTHVYTWYHVVHVAPFQHYPMQRDSLMATLRHTCFCVFQVSLLASTKQACEGEAKCIPLRWTRRTPHRRTCANAHTHPPWLLFALLSLSLVLCLASCGASSMPLKHRSRWFEGQFRMMVPFSTSGSLQLLSSVLSILEMKNLLAYPHVTPLRYFSAPIRNPESKSLFELPS